ncbi:uncharacterized protein TNCV_2360071 [Trichonephila clavipes]|nr:uncharacterized protein TNCV_2360071 [Trichonephila clavipes]
MLLVPRKCNSLNNVPPVHFLIDFNALFHKNQRRFATGTNSAPDHDRLWILAMFNNCRCSWSVHTPDFIVLGVMYLLNRQELLLIEKEFLPTLTFGPSQKSSSSSVLCEFFFFFFSKKLKFSQLATKLRFCYSPHRSVTYSHVTSDLSHGNLGFPWTRFSIPLSVYRAFSSTSWTSTIIAKLFETADYIRHCLPSGQGNGLVAGVELSTAVDLLRWGPSTLNLPSLKCPNVGVVDCCQRNIILSFALSCFADS